MAGMSVHSESLRKISGLSSMKSRSEVLMDAEQAGADIALVKFSKEDEAHLKIVVGVHLTIDRPWKTIRKSSLIETMEEMKGVREYMKKLKSYSYDEVLIGYEVGLGEGDGHLICLTEVGRQHILEKLAQLHETLTKQVKEYLHRSTPKVSLSSEVSASPESRQRPPITYEWVAKIQPRVEQADFGPIYSHALFYSRILSRNKSSIKLVESAVQHKEVLATPASRDCSAQTEPEIAINDGTQFLPEVDLPTFIELSPEEEEKLAQVCRTYSDTVIEASGYNSLFDLYKDDYSELLGLGSPLSITKSARYRHFMSFTDFSQHEGKMLTDLSFHPSVAGLVAASYGNTTANNVLQLNSDSEEDDYTPTDDEKKWNITKLTVADRDQSELKEWNRKVKRIDQLMTRDYDETMWQASEVTLDSIETAMKIRDFEVHHEKLRHESMPDLEAEIDEYDMFYLPYGNELQVRSALAKTALK